MAGIPLDPNRPYHPTLLMATATRLRFIGSSLYTDFIQHHFTNQPTLTHRINGHRPSLQISTRWEDARTLNVLDGAVTAGYEIVVRVRGE